MVTYRTPGVYVEEIASLPPSVAEVATAIPAFIGYTAAEGYNGDGRYVAFVNNMIEYTAIFGGPSLSTYSLTTETITDSANPLTSLARIKKDSLAQTSVAHKYLMYYLISHYFQNGGGRCCVVSVGKYGTEYSKANFEDGLSELEKEDEPTLIVLTDAVNLPSSQQYYDVCKAALQQCNRLGDRFAIFDIFQSDSLTDPVKEFRDKIGMEYLKYGAAYYPWLNTSLVYQYDEAQVAVTHSGSVTIDAPLQWAGKFGGIIVEYVGSSSPTVTISKDGEPSSDPGFDITDSSLKITVGLTTKAAAVISAWGESEKQGFFVKAGKGTTIEAALETQLEQQTTAIVPAAQTTLSVLATTSTALHNQIKLLLSQQRVILPPSAAIAGVYASMDRDRGVWKAPANVSLNGVIGPEIKITSAMQDTLNIDPTGGKSINAIRAFNGKGTLVWGARTLAGNDNEWRYINVRRLFIMIEESVQKSTGFAVFEANDSTTWLKVKAMIEGYLYGLWQQGALAGPDPKSAYFVNVGLGKTMTAQDVLEGRLIVEVGIAAVRPAEFIILKFSHKLQQA